MREGFQEKVNNLPVSTAFIPTTPEPPLFSSTSSHIWVMVPSMITPWPDQGWLYVPALPTRFRAASLSLLPPPTDGPGASPNAPFDILCFYRKFAYFLQLVKCISTKLFTMFPYYHSNIYSILVMIFLYLLLTISFPLFLLITVIGVCFTNLSMYWCLAWFIFLLSTCFLFH